MKNISNLAMVRNYEAGRMQGHTTETNCSGGCYLR
jgi:hypothetical protein